MSFITSVSNAESTPIIPTELEPTLAGSILPDLQTLIYSHLNLDDLSKVEEANKEFEHPTNIDRALQVHKEMLLKENPEYITVLEAWEKENIPLSEQNARIKELRQLAFGRDKWFTHFGEIGEITPLPADIYQILNEDCPFFKGKKVKETHRLVLVPKTVTLKDKEPMQLSLKSFGDLVKTPKEGYKAKYGYFHAEHHAEDPVRNSHWVLMTNDILPGSREKGIDRHKMVEKVQYYQVPHAIDAVASIFMTYVNTGVKLFPSYPSILTMCQERLNGVEMMVGSFHHIYDSLDVHNQYGLYGSWHPEFFTCGVAAQRIL